MPRTNISAPKPRVRRKAARPAEIIAAALDLFVERGFAATKLEDVAARAGIGKGTIHLYFPNKEELFRALLQHGWLPNLEAAEAIIAAHTGPTPELLRKLAAHMLSVIHSRSTVVPKLVLAESGNFPAIARLHVEEVRARAMAMMAGVVARGVARGEFRPLDVPSVVPLFGAPFVTMALLKELVARHADIPFDPAKVIAVHLDIFLRGLAAEAPQ